MPRPQRCEQFDHSEVCIVHVVQRCVRRAFLAGVDRGTGVDYSFRKEWIRRRMEALASVFAVDVLSYAVMSNHIHQILRNRPDVVKEWSDQETAIRWLKVFPGRRLEEHLAEPTDHDVQALCNDTERMIEIRKRLSDLSWFMRALAEPIARMANKQDECTGRFWEGRFKVQRIVDEAGLLACSMYVDLNPVRAAITDTPDRSVHTSAYDRIQSEKGRTINSAAFDLKPVATEEAAKTIQNIPVSELKKAKQKQRVNPTGRTVRRDAWLSPLTMKPTEKAGRPEVHSDGLRSSDKGFLSLSMSDYLKLLRWTARQTSSAMSNMPEALSKKLTSIGISAGMWRDLVWHWQKYFGRSVCVGKPNAMRQQAESTGHQWHRGQAAAACCFQ